MARGNRQYLPGGYIWHITHRCHKGEFLLKFGRDRRLWMRWLFEAKKRYGLCVLNYMVTSNHIHLLVEDSGGEVIQRSIQLIAGITARDYNRRKKRKGAFWEDRYHATAVEVDSHLIRCLIYIDMNMVRAGIVDDPREWAWCGYHEIQNPPQRYAIIDRGRLMSLVGILDSDELIAAQRGWVEDALSVGEFSRESMWTETIAVGSRRFVEGVGEKLGVRAAGREVLGANGSYELRESEAAYSCNFDTENGPLSLENAYFWDDY